MVRQARLLTALVIGASAALGAPPALAAPLARAQGPTTVAVMALRVQPGTVSTGVFQEANNLVWQRILTVPGIKPMAESHIAARLGPGTYGTIRRCAQDACMAQVAQLTGVQRVVWGWIQATPAGGFVVELRVVDGLGRLHGRSSPGCQSCSESGVLAALASWDAITLNLSSGQPAAPSPPIRPPGTPPPGFARQAPARQVAPPTAPLPPPIARPPPRTGAAPGRLRLKTRPTGAQAWINGRSVGVTPLRDIELYAGVYRVALRAEGHRDEVIEVTVLPGKTVREKINLVPTTGTLTVSVKPKGARVAVDGRTIGTAPIKRVRLPLGDHVIDVWLAGYASVRKNVSLLPRKPVKLALKLVSTSGKLTVASRPGGASVRVDGEFVGVTPLRKHSLDAGEHEVIVYLSGFEEQTRNVLVAGGSSTKVKFKLRKQAPTDGKLVITSKPAGARVMIGTQEVGVTPVSIEYRKGFYMLRWMLAGYEPVEKKVEVRGGKKNKFSVKLQRALPAAGYGELTILPKPAETEILVEGTSYGTDGVKDRLMLAGRYSVTLKADGYHEMTFAVLLPSRKRVVVKKKLKKLPPPPPDGVLNVTTSPVGASVWVTGVEVGKSPVAGYKLRPGWYNLQIRKDGFESHSEQFEAKPKANTNFDVRLSSRFATLKLSSTPEGAIVFLGGQELGVTPGEWHKIRPGAYDVVISKIGQNEKVLHLTLARDTVTDRKVFLGAAGAFLTLRSLPAGARVYIDGEEVGVTPLSRHELAPGPHKINLVLDGYEEVAGDVELASKENKALRFPMRKLPEPTPPPEEEASDEPVAGAGAGQVGQPTAAAAAPKRPMRTLSAPSGPVGGMPGKEHRMLAPGEAVGIPNSGAPEGGPPPGAPPPVEGQMDPSAPGQESG